MWAFLTALLQLFVVPVVTRCPKCGLSPCQCKAPLTPEGVRSAEEEAEEIERSRFGKPDQD